MAPAGTTEHDFRRPSSLGRDLSRGIEHLHEGFVRRLASTWGSELRAHVDLAVEGIVQLPYQEAVRSMPNPDVLVAAMAAPTGGPFAIEFDVQFGLRLVDRLLGAGDDEVPEERTPSDVEVDLLEHVGAQAVAALAPVLAPLGSDEPTLSSVALDPYLLRIAAPADPVLVVAFTVTVSGPMQATGTLSVLYPPTLVAALHAYLDSMQQDPPPAPVDPVRARALLGGLGAAAVELTVSLQPSTVPARALRALQVGDVLRLDHRVGRPAVAAIGDVEVLDVAIGCVGPRRGVQVVGWRDDAEDVPPSSSLLGGSQVPHVAAVPVDPLEQVPPPTPTIGGASPTAVPSLHEVMQ